LQEGELQARRLGLVAMSQTRMAAVTPLISMIFSHLPFMEVCPVFRFGRWHFPPGSLTEATNDRSRSGSGTSIVNKVFP
jgi:hypothetical protein